MESRPGAIEEKFISYSPMSDIAQEAADDMSVYEILPFEESMSESEKNSENGISAGISVGDFGKPAGNNIENNRWIFLLHPQALEETRSTFRLKRAKGNRRLLTPCGPYQLRELRQRKQRHRWIQNQP